MNMPRLALLSFLLSLLLSACAAQPGYRENSDPPEGASVLRLPGGISCILPRNWTPLGFSGDASAPEPLAAAPVVAAKYDAQRAVLARFSVRDMATRAGFDQSRLRGMSDAERATLQEKSADAARQMFGETSDVLSVVSRLREMGGYLCLVTTAEFIPVADNPAKQSLTTVRAEYLLGRRYVSADVTYATDLQSPELDREIEIIFASFNPESKWEQAEKPRASEES